MFETKREPVISRSHFFKRFAKSFCIGMLVIGVGVLIGCIGYRTTEGMSWLDAFVNASMILSTMGPVSHPSTNAGKLFSAFYALFSGLVFVTIVGVVFAPVVHRFMHTFHAKKKQSN